MTVKFVKPLVALSAITLALTAPASAQIAKFHVMAPAVPGFAKLDRTAGSDAVLGDFLGATADMAKETSASMDEMRDAENIIDGDAQEISRETGDRDAIFDGIQDRFERTDENTGENPGMPPMQRPELIASADDAGQGAAIVSRPDMGRQVVVRTRTKSPRGGSKIKPGALWSVGEFR